VFFFIFNTAYMPFTRGLTEQQVARFHPIPVISSGIFEVPLSTVALTESAVISAALAVADKSQQSTNSLNPAHARHAVDGSPVDGNGVRVHSCLRLRCCGVLTGRLRRLSDGINSFWLLYIYRDWCAITASPFSFHFISFLPVISWGA
jgi:hypothetical protein